MILKRRNVEVEATEQAEIRKLISDGFEPYDYVPEAVSEEPEGYETMTVKELRALAESKGIKMSHALRKQDIIEMLEEGND